MYGIANAPIDLVNDRCACDIRDDSGLEGLIFRILDDMPDDVAEAILNDIHGFYDYE